MSYGDLSARGAVSGDDGVRILSADRASGSRGDADTWEVLPLINAMKWILWMAGNGFSRWH